MEIARLVANHNAIPMLCLAIVQGCCRGVEKIVLSDKDDALTPECSHFLAGALDVDGNLPVLTTLELNFKLPPGGISMLARALTGGAAPRLQCFSFNETGCTENDVNSISDMVEAHALIPKCNSFTYLDSNVDQSGEDSVWFDQASIATRIRLLRTLLPSVEDLPRMTWSQDFEPCFLAARVQYLKRLDIVLANDGSVFSWKVFEAAPPLMDICLFGNQETFPAVSAALHSVSAALCYGFLEKLVVFCVIDCTLRDGDLGYFVDALERSSCAERLVELAFSCMGIDVLGVQALADLISRGSFPTLKRFLGCSSPIGATGVAVLAEALLRPTPTFLSELNLDDVGMGDQGRLEHLEEFNIGENALVTDLGICALARAIDAHGLPRLTSFGMEYLAGLTSEGISAIALAVIKGCPQLEETNTKDSGSDNKSTRVIIQDMLRAVGRAGEVRVT